MMIVKIRTRENELKYRFPGRRSFILSHRKTRSERPWAFLSEAYGSGCASSGGGSNKDRDPGKTL